MTGCHRSGTSLLAAIIQDLRGLKAKARSAELELKLENPRGFFESKRLMELNESLLDSIGLTWKRLPLLSPEWDSVESLQSLKELRSAFSFYALNQNWVDKDPRLCLTYGAYLHIFLKRVPIVAVIRNPIDVATSLYSRDGIKLEEGLTLWFLYNYHLAGVIQENDCLTTYQDLLDLKDNYSSSLTRTLIDNFLVNLGEGAPSKEVWKNVVKSRIELSLNRSNSIEFSQLNNNYSINLTKICSDLYEKVVDSSAKISAFRETFYSIPRPILDVFRNSELRPESINKRSSLEKELRLEEMVNESNVQIKDLRGELKALRSSKSWKITKPMRQLLELIKGL